MRTNNFLIMLYETNTLKVKDGALYGDLYFFQISTVYKLIIYDYELFEDVKLLILQINCYPKLIKAD